MPGQYRGIKKLWRYKIVKGKLKKSWEIAAIIKVSESSIKNKQQKSGKLDNSSEDDPRAKGYDNVKIIPGKDIKRKVRG